MSRKAKDRAALEERIGYKFADKALLERAVTHISALAGGATPAHSYQRLGFLGDHVLGLVIFDMLSRAGSPTWCARKPARRWRAPWISGPRSNSAIRNRTPADACAPPSWPTPARRWWGRCLSTADTKPLMR